MGLAAIDGFNGFRPKRINDDLKNIHQVASCMKYFVGYGVPINGKDRAPANITDTDLREYFLPSFKAAIDAKAPTLMVNSGEVAGVPLPQVNIC
jgi:beta-glucosidase